jgi:hypothetical protein
MPRKPRKLFVPPNELAHRWYLAEWAEHFGKRQADAQRELGWPKSNASDLFNGKQRYTQNLVDDVARWLNIAPYEVLMHPKEALAIRSLRDSARLIVDGLGGRSSDDERGARGTDRAVSVV